MNSVKIINRYIKSMKTQVSVESLSENTMSRSHAHIEFELYFLIDGNRRLLIKNNFYKMEKGDILLISPGILHKTQNESPSQYKRMVINFPKNLLESVFGKADYLEFSKKEAIMVRCPNVYHLLIDAVEELEKASKNESSSYGEFELLTASILYKLVYYLKSGENVLPETKVLEKNNAHISAILEYINHNFATPITLPGLSKQFFLSEYYLCRSFKKSTGRTIVEYINYLRIEKAKLILTEENKSIKEIAKLCGFNTTAHFNHIFKEYEKINPSQYKALRK